MTAKLFIHAMAKFLTGVILVGALIFLPAGTFYFFNGWLFMLLLFVPMLFVGFVLMVRNPELLKKRLNIKEKRKEQALIIKLSELIFLLGFIVSGLDFRFGWHTLPKMIVVSAAVVFLIAYTIYFLVLFQNEYLSRTIEVQKNQKVIDKGLYSVVRHPMYSSTLLLFLSMPLVLGSIYSFLIFLIYPFLIVKRIKDEERFLEKELEGYSEYKQRVKYRLIPFLW